MFRCRAIAAAIVSLATAIAPLPALAEWPQDPAGLPIAALSAAEYQPAVISDGAGGTIVAWQDNRLPNNFDIYAQRIGPTGVPLWTVNGTGVCVLYNDQVNPGMVSDGAGGALIVWQDNREGGNIHLYAQRLDAAGIPQWAPNGVALPYSGGSQYYPAMCPDASGGAIVGFVSTLAPAGLYAQRFDAAGVPQWSGDGVPLCTVSGTQLLCRIVSDGTGGAIIAWQDARTDTSNIYAQRISAAGTVLWAANGAPVCTAPGAQSSPVIATDGAGGR